MKNSGELIKAIKSRDSSVRRHAIEMLGTRGDEIVIDALIPVLKDNNRFVRQEAIIALEKIGGERIIESLTLALVEEKDEFVRESIKKTLKRLEK